MLKNKLGWWFNIPNHTHTHIQIYYVYYIYITLVQVISLSVFGLYEHKLLSEADGESGILYD